MSKRLQIIVSDEEAQRFRRCAEREGMTLSEWARQAMARARNHRLGPSSEQKLKALDKALRCGHPTGDMDEILSDIERGRALR